MPELLLCDSISASKDSRSYLSLPLLPNLIENLLSVAYEEF